MTDNEQQVVKAELPAGMELDKPFRNPEGSGSKFSVYTKGEDGDVVKVPFGDPDMEILRDDPARRKAFRERFSCDTDPGPKWKPKFWSCRMWDEKSVTEILNAQKVSAAFASPGFDGKAPDSIVFFPAGKHEISASKNGKPAKVSVDITADVAELLDAQLKDSLKAAENGTASRPFIDFEHTGGRAAALPKAFRWDAALGVMVDLEWTPAGRAAVEGKEFSYFSPEWLMADGKITGLSQPGPIGGLVNTPAFQVIPKIAASLTNTIMELSKLIELLKQLGIEIADDATEEMIMEAMKNGMSKVKEVEAVAAAHVKDSNDLITARASIVSLTNQIETLTAAHTAELAKVKASVNEEVAKVVASAALPKPLVLPQDNGDTAHVTAAKTKPEVTGLARVIAALSKKK